MSALTDRITEVLRLHGDSCTRANAEYLASVLEAEALQPLFGELEATKLLLDATREQLSRTIADFCAVRDALPREQVEQILAAAWSPSEPEAEKP